MQLTAIGEMLLEDARDIVGRADDAVAKLKSAARGERGQLRIGFVAHGAGEVGTEILRRFGEVYPAIGTELVSATSLEELQRHVGVRETDVAFVWLPLLYDELDAGPVLSERKLVAMHPEHRLTAKKDVLESDLFEESIVAPWEDFPSAFMAAWFGRIRPDGRRSEDPSAVSVDESLTFVSRGLAVYCVPESVSRFYPRPDIVFRPISDSSPVQVAIAWLEQSSNPAVASFVEVVRMVVRERGESAAVIQSIGS